MNVTVYARNAAKVPASWPADVRVVVGEITDAGAIDTTVAGADAVISALGPSMDKKAAGLPLVDGTKLIIEAMHRHGVKRFIGNGTPSVIDKRDKGTLQQKFARVAQKQHVTGVVPVFAGSMCLGPQEGLQPVVMRTVS
jgi:nucleoside-diphosphate-sugar epimerase